MAVLTAAERAAISERVARFLPTVPYEKATAFLAIQATEDWFETNRANLNTAINIATAPVVLTVAQKKLIVAHWLQHKTGKEQG